MREAIGVAVVGAVCACQSPQPAAAPGIVRIDGSSTLFPLTRAVIQDFTKERHAPQFRLTMSGTAHGFEQLCGGRTDLSAASRPIRRAEIEACHEAGVTFIELPIAYDGIAAVVHPRATWIDDITVEELRMLWHPSAQGRVHHWSQIRSQWPDRAVRLYGADTQSGTYDYFTAAVNGEEGASRHDFTGSVNDDDVVDAVARDELAFAFIPMAYYEKHRHRVKVVAVSVAAGQRPVTPSADTIRAGTYQPLSRPLFIYVRKQALTHEGIPEFVDFYLLVAARLAQRLGYISLAPQAYDLAAERRRAQWTGTIFGEGGSQVGLTMNTLLEKARLR